LRKDKYRNIADCLVITAGLVVIGLITEIEILFYIAATLGVLTALISPLAKAISFIWNWIGIILGFFVSKIVLAIVFYIILFPFSILHKLFSKNKSISNRKKESYWVIKEKRELDFNKLW
jgi:hypothetical protein